jgi:hypothetical protein
MDTSADIRKAAEAAAASRYSKAAIEELQAVIMRVFETEVLPDIVKNFENISLTIAQFYAARVAHKKKFGRE